MDRLLYGFESQEFSTSFHSGDVVSYPNLMIASKSSIGRKVIVMAWERCD
jgi:hypothetical protein